MKNLPQRKSIRLKNFNYSSQGYYFVTICTKNRNCLFGKIVDGEMILNRHGMIVKNEWLKTPSIRKNATLDEYQIMPNHLHGIIVIANKNPRRGVLHTPVVLNTPDVCDTGLCNKPLRSPSNNLGAIIRGFKSTTTKQINTSLCGRIWQRNYYEHVIRTDNDLNKIREYIINNPKLWNRDENNPKNWGK